MANNDVENGEEVSGHIIIRVCEGTEECHILGPPQTIVGFMKELLGCNGRL